MSAPARKSGPVVIVVLFALMVLLHQDVWWWQSERIVLGFLPISMAYHIGFTFVTALLWWAAGRWAWPDQLEAWADADAPNASLHSADGDRSEQRQGPA